MRSYYAHLEGAKPKADAHPVFRSSAIFPVFHQSQISSRVLFLGYWVLKRKIPEITVVATLRSSEGESLHRISFPIQEPKAYRLELVEFLQAAGISSEDTFFGSLEVEFFSTVNLVFPYPACVINYWGPKFSTVVHTAQRVYNDFEDRARNSEVAVPEGGFNLWVTEDEEPFLTVINGGEEMASSPVHFQFYNSCHEEVSFEHNLGTLKPFQTSVIYPAQLFDLKGFLKNEVGTAKVSFSVNWVYPRIVVGNIHHQLPALTLTHTYYDCTESERDVDYWSAPDKGWHVASLLLPAMVDEGHFTRFYFYPLCSPSTFYIDVELYSHEGLLLGSRREALEVISPSQKFNRLDVKSLCQELGIKGETHLGVRLIARASDGKKIPARVKLGFDVGGKIEGMSCNICTNMQLYRPDYQGRSGTFRWLPLLADQKEPSVIVVNSSPEQMFKQQATVDVTAYRESDSKTLKRQWVLPPHGFKIVRLDEDEELKTFLEGKVGWLTLRATNPYLTTYYFTENASGVVGGDHGF